MEAGLVEVSWAEAEREAVAQGRAAAVLQQTGR